MQDITAAGGRASCVQADVADPQSPYNIVSAALRAFDVDYIDILVNNAGVAQNTKLKDITIEEYEKQMAINVRSVIFMTQQVLPYLKRDRGGNRIINLSSISARGGFATQTVYAASKAAVEGLTRVWAKELRHECNVTVNAVNPGPVDTDSTEQLGQCIWQEWKSRIRTFLQRRGVGGRPTLLTLLHCCALRRLGGSQAT